MNRPETTNQNGVALVLVLWALVFLSALATNFASGMRIQAKLTRNNVDQIQAYYAARGGVDLAVARTVQRMQYTNKHTTRNADNVGNTANNLNLDRVHGAAGEEQDQEQQEEEQELWKIDGTPNDAELKGVNLRVFITNEAGKVDINETSESILRNLLEQFQLLPEQIDVIVDSVADWKDGDNLHRMNGAEDDYYKKLDPPYKAKNDKFSSVEELLRVRGVTPEILYRTMPPPEDGDQTAAAADAAPADTGETAGGEPARLRLIDCLTVYNKGGKIDLRYAPVPVLRSLPLLSAGLANRVIELRNDLGVERLTAAEIRQALGEDIYAGIEGYVNTGGGDENYFSIVSEAHLENDFTAKIKAMVNIPNRGNEQATVIQWTDWVS
jgi:general secretion pathway protein K